MDTNLQLSGQQIVVLTAGTGYFEVCIIHHLLTSITSGLLVPSMKGMCLLADRPSADAADQ